MTCRCCCERPGPSGGGSRGSRSPRHPPSGARSGSWPPWAPDRARPASPSGPRGRLGLAGDSRTSPPGHRRTGPARPCAAPPMPRQARGGRRCASRGEMTPPWGVPVIAPRTTPSSMTPARRNARRSLRIVRSLTRRSTAAINRSCGNRLEARGDVRLDHPAPTLPGLVEEDLQGIVGRRFGPEAEGAGPEVGLEDRLQHDLRRRLHDAVADRGDRERRCSELPGFGIHTRRVGSGRYCLPAGPRPARRAAGRRRSARRRRG